MTTIQLTIPNELAEQLNSEHIDMKHFNIFLNSAIEAWLKYQAEVMEDMGLAAAISEGRQNQFVILHELENVL